MTKISQLPRIMINTQNSDITQMKMFIDISLYDPLCLHTIVTKYFYSKNKYYVEFTPLGINELGVVKTKDHYSDSSPEAYFRPEKFTEFHLISIFCPCFMPRFRPETNVSS